MYNEIKGLEKRMLENGESNLCKRNKKRGLSWGDMNHRGEFPRFFNKRCDFQSFEAFLRRVFRSIPRISAARVRLPSTLAGHFGYILPPLQQGCGRSCFPQGRKTHEGGEVRDFDEVPFGHDDEPLDHILQFPHISGPVVVLEDLEGLIGKLGRRPVQFPGKFGCEMED